MNLITASAKFEVLELYARQSWAIDGGDADGWAQTFAPDGIFNSPSYGDAFVGFDALHQFALDVALDAAKQGHQLQHIVANLNFSPVNEQLLIARGYLSLLAVVPLGSTRILRNVWLVDKIARTADGWRFTRRDVSLTPPQITLDGEGKS